ncbi:unnamed protein product [Allacma fusca]|uniref:Uncharacterized protein n=1 Tax=Allacma fusca TaxID=39272 RepID=A0A8J2JAP9_9HEXA|nr:unnamed protein product [Allacma fusca]
MAKDLSKFPSTDFLKTSCVDNYYIAKVAVDLIQNLDNMELRTITRAALGRVAKLGDLYDARCDKFCDISILKGGAPESAIYCTDNHFSDTVAYM